MNEKFYEKNYALKPSHQYYNKYRELVEFLKKTLRETNAVIIQTAFLEAKASVLSSMELLPISAYLLERDIIKKVNSYYFYKYQYIDTALFMKDAYKILKQVERFSPYANETIYFSALTKKFKSYGWKGDGNMEFFWLPPFVTNTGKFESIAGGAYVWHVKQDNISWLASKAKLPFKHLTPL